jgi:hypothetical protein
MEGLVELADVPAGDGVVGKGCVFIRLRLQYVKVNGET